MGWVASTIRIFRFVLPMALALFFFSLTEVGARRAPWYELALWNVLGPVTSVFSTIGHAVTGVWTGYLNLVHVRADNVLLKQQIAAWEGKASEAAEIKNENERLRGLLDFARARRFEVMGARIVANDPRAEFKSVMIDRGSADGLRVFLPVVSSRGVVGSIGKVAKHRSLVLLINDPNSTVDVVVQRSRARALLVGSSSRTELRPAAYLSRLEYLHRTSDVEEGDVVVTSGFDHIFPAGLPVGTVTHLQHHELGVFQDADVVPYENFAELQEVLVLLIPE